MNPKQVVRRVLFRALGLAGLGHALHARNRRAGRIPVVVLHRVSPHPDPFWPPYSPEAFARLIAFLARRYRFVAVEDLLTKPPEELRDGIVITFDDAWHDFVTHALPVLRKHRVPVVQFVATGPIGQRSLIWTSLLDQAFRHTACRSLAFTLEGRSYRYALKDEAHRIRASLQVQHLLKQVPDRSRRHAFDDIVRQLGAPPPDPGCRLCTWEDLRALMPEVPLHAHTVTHPFLPHVADDDQLDAELADSQRALAEELGARARYLAYPMGGYDARVMERAAGCYDAAFTTGNTLVDLQQLGSDPGYRFQVPRFNLTDTEPQEAYLRLNGFHGRLFRLIGGGR